MRAKTITNPIIDWEDSDIYSYIDQEHICINQLYCQGFPRVGCIGCPMAGRRARELEFERYPTYKKAYITAIGKMIKSREAAGLKPFAPRTAQGMFDWWMETGILDGQLKLEMGQDE